VAQERAHIPAGIREPGSYSTELEGLRGVAILLVFAFHASGLASPDRQHVDPLRAYVYAGHTGVTLFFVLSAFLLSRPFLAEANGGPRQSWRRFYERRALRILPLYYLAVIFAALARAEHPAELLRGAPYLLLLNSFVGVAQPLNPYSDVWWSLATEWQFYLLLPLASLLLASRWRLVVGGALLLAYGVAYVWFVTGRWGMDSMDGQLQLGVSLFGRGPAFGFGILAAWLWERHGEALRRAGRSRAWLRRGGADALLAAVVVCLGLLLARVARLGFFQAEAQLQAWHVPEALLWSLFVLIVLLAPLRSAFLLSNRLLGFVGVISYSLYLVHLPILYRIQIPLLGLVGGKAPGWTARAVAGTVAALAASLALSTLTYRLVERPFLRRKARIRA
jgi:peptidoglycan/LPS O-acetylase OafA/YrhL